MKKADKELIIKLVDQSINFLVKEYVFEGPRHIIYDPMYDEIYETSEANWYGIYHSSKGFVLLGVL